MIFDHPRDGLSPVASIQADFGGRAALIFRPADDRFPGFLKAGTLVL
jgi:hypothetical protein